MSSEAPGEGCTLSLPLCEDVRPRQTLTGSEYHGATSAMQHPSQEANHQPRQRDGHIGEGPAQPSWVRGACSVPSLHSTRRRGLHQEKEQGQGRLSRRLGATEGTLQAHAEMLRVPQTTQEASVTTKRAIIFLLVEGLFYFIL